MPRSNSTEQSDRHRVGTEVMGEAAMMSSEEPGNGAYQRQWLGAAGFRIAGDTDEIMREDKDATFAELEKVRGKR